MQMKTHFIEGAQRLAVTAAGRGPLVLMVHGMGGDRSTWTPQIEALSHEFTAASVDLRGYGDSGDLRGPLDFKKDFAADLMAVLDYFGVDRAHLVGLSMGGRVARTAALQYPDRTASLTLANTSAGFDTMDEAEIRRFIEDRSRPLQGTEVLPADFGQTQAVNMMAPDADAHAIRTAAAAIQRLRPVNYLAVLDASTRQDRGDRVEDIGCPVLAITGSLDRVYPQEVTRQLIGRLRHVTHVPIEGAGHISNLEKPVQFNEALLRFLRSLPREAQALT